MRLDVLLTPAEFAGADLAGASALVVDVLRATSTVVAACAAGCREVIPAADAEAARAVAGALGPGIALLGGERGGDPIAGFDLGNSPLEYTPERVAGRTVVLSTSNGTAAMRVAGRAAAAALAAFTNLGAAAAWARAQPRDVVVLCAGTGGALALEDAVCAGMLVARMAARGPGGGWVLTDAAVAARRLAAPYARRLPRLAREAAWARRLAARGHAADVAACLALDTVTEVPVLAAGVVRPGAAGEEAAPRPRAGARA
jgi:2-phosphosulfolactate phosphatase